MATVLLGNRATLTRGLVVTVAHVPTIVRLPAFARLPTVALLLTIALLVGCAQQLIRRESQEAWQTGDYERAVALLEAGVQRYPESAPLRGALTQARTDALSRLLSQAGTLRSAERLDEAAALLQRAKTVDPRNARVEALLSELLVQRSQGAALAAATRLVEDKKPDAALDRIREALKDNPRHPGLTALKQRLELEIKHAQAVNPRRALREGRPISLDFRDADLRTVLDVVSRNSGINFIIDRDIRADAKVRVFIKQATVEEALDLIIGTNQLARKVIDDQTILVYPNTAEKQREYQEQVVRVFHLATSDAKNAAAFLKAMLKVREPFVDERSNMLALRDSPENIRLAERLLSVFDAGEPEVLMEVEVIEVSRSSLTDLGIKFPDTLSLSPVAPGEAAALTLGNIRSLTRDNILLGIGGVTVSLKRESGDFQTLANPRIRARNREKAKVLIGDKIPVVTTTTGVGGFVSDSINYIEVGLKLDVEPTVYADDDVGIKVALEVSSIGSAIRTTSGSLAYQIGTRNASTVLRLRDGETQLLAGLISNDERASVSGVPVLADVPLLGRLFSSHQDRGQRSELVLAITPRILRNLRKLDSSESEISVGTEALPELRLPTAARAAPAPTGAREGAGAPEGGAVGQAPVVARAASPQAVPLAARVAPPKDMKVTATLVPSTTQPTVGQTVEVQVRVSTTGPLRGLPLGFSWDRSRLQFVDLVEGDFLNRAEGSTALSQSVDSENGRLRIGASRGQGLAPAGEGLLLTLRFKAIAAGPTVLSPTGVQPVSDPATAVDMAPIPGLALTVK